MAEYRNIQMSFWTDSKIEDDFTSKDKFFYLFLITNPMTSLCGCYECSKRQMSRYTGYTSEEVEELLYRMEYLHGVIKYDNDTKEVLLLNWHKHNWTNSVKVLKGVYAGARSVKCEKFREYIHTLLIEYGYPMDSGVFAEKYPMDKTFRFVSDIDISVEDNTTDESDTKVEHTDNVELPKSRSKINDSINTVEKYKEDKYEAEVKEIIDYLNAMTGSTYSHKTKLTRDLVHGRLSDGYSVDDFKKVIDTKIADWRGTKQEKFIRPQTLFRQSNFENYLNQKSADPIEQRKNKWDRIAERAEERLTQRGKMA